MEDNLTIKLKKGENNRKDLEEVYNRFYEKIYSFIFLKTQNESKSEDLTGEVFIKFIDYVKEHDVDNVNALLYKIARNLIIDDVRKKKEDLIGDDVLNTITDNTENKLDLISNEQLMEVISSLTDDYRDVIVMYYINDMTIREIADVFNKTEGAIRTMLSRAIKALKKELKIA